MNAKGNKKQWYYWAEELLSISQAGLTYSKDDFDIECFKRLKQLLNNTAIVLLRW